MAAKRIYVVKSKVKADASFVEEIRLVRAKTSQGAINHVVGDRITAAIASQDDLVDFASRVKVEDAGEAA